MTRRSHGRIPTYDHEDFTVELLVQAKGSHKVSVCIPARNEDSTVGAIVSVIRDNFVKKVHLVDEIVVVDDGSLDATAKVAANAGARVVPSSEPDAKGRPQAIGKGGAMRRGVEATSGDVVLFLDADVTSFSPHFVSGMLGPLLTNDEIVLVKAFYDRPISGAPVGGGRVTELVAKPVLERYFAELCEVVQPLAGETALRRSIFDKFGLDEGYRVEISLLLDVADTFGTGLIAQVDLGSRVHRNRPLHELAPVAKDVLFAVLDRAGAKLNERKSETMVGNEI